MALKSKQFVATSVDETKQGTGVGFTRCQKKRQMQCWPGDTVKRWKLSKGGWSKRQPIYYVLLNQRPPEPLCFPCFLPASSVPRGVQKDPKPKIRTENPIPDLIFRVPEPKYLVFLVRVPEPIILSGYRFGYGSGFLPKRVPDNPKYFF